MLGAMSGATGADEPGVLDVRWHQGRTADEALAGHARDAAGVDADRVRVGRLCPQCGSATHGRPWVEVRDGYAARLHVSVARSGPHVVTALADRPVGVDAEHVGDVARGWDPALVLAPGERADSPLEQARAWTRKEAVLKAWGTGLTTPMTRIVLAEVDWVDLAAPPGHVAAVSPGRAGPAGPSRAATRGTARPGRRR